MHILVIDDEPLFQEIIEHKLAKNGEKNVVFASSGGEALDIIRRSAIPFDLFLVDIQMPLMDGIDLVSAIRKLSNCLTTPITMITKVTERDAVDQAFAAGASDYITKPVVDLEFRARINVMQQMNAERQLNESLKQASHKDGWKNRKVDFEEALDLPAVDFLIEQSALKSYLAALGYIERMAQSVVCFHIENLSSIYSRSDNDLFIDVVEDIATTLLSSLRSRVAMISYIGSGTFVCVLSHSALVEPEVLMNSVEDSKSSSSDFYSRHALPQPAFRCGKTSRFGVFSLKSVDQVFERAIKSARQLSSGADRKMRRIA